MNELFYELIRVAIGTKDNLSRMPSEREWSKLYRMAERQSLVGVCFAALKRLGADADEGYARIGMSKMLYLTWMCMAVTIQQKNQIVDEHCAALQKRLSADGFKCCILKGQGVACQYAEHLLGLRQSGDIDVWIDAPPKETINWVRANCGESKHDYHHVDADLFPDTQVELHFRPTLSRNIMRDLKIQKWTKRYVGKFVYDEKIGFSVPILEFNIVYILHHIYWHVMFGGCGLRQLMDMYFVMMQERTDAQNEEIAKSLKYLGIERFARAVMFILHDVFGLKEDRMICHLDEELGAFLLKDILRTGNMGHHDETKKKTNGTKLSYLWRDTTYGFRLFKYFPVDVLWIPFGMIYISLRGKMIRID